MRQYRYGQVAQTATVARSNFTMLLAFNQNYSRSRIPGHPLRGIGAMEVWEIESQSYRKHGEFKGVQGL